MMDVLWTEKYRPTRLSECVVSDGIRSTFSKFIADGILPNLLLSGGPGVGKTTVALAAIDELGADSLVINASLYGNIDTLRNDVTQFASSVSLRGGRKYVILDEADYLNANSTQPSLRNFIETFSKNCGFVLTANYPNRIIPPLRSRLTEVPFDASREESPSLMFNFMKRAKFILESEGVEYDRDSLAKVIANGYPDWRRVINDLQYHASRGKIDHHAVTTPKTNLDALVSHMRAKSFDGVMSWVAENAADMDHVGVIRSLYDGASKYVVERDIPLLIVLLGKYQNMAAQVADLEVNTAAMLVEITAECEFK